MALVADKLRAWPFAGPVGLREHNPRTQRSEVHVFDQWCHLGTAQSDEALQETLQSRPAVLAFDLDTYKLALKYLLPPGKAGVTPVALRNNQNTFQPMINDR